jgi:hypothetical protein
MIFFESNFARFKIFGIRTFSRSATKVCLPGVKLQHSNYIEKNTEIEKPIAFLLFDETTSANHISQSRIIVNANQNSKAEIIEKSGSWFSYKDNKIDCDYKKIKMDAQRELIETFL